MAMLWIVLSKGRKASVVLIDVYSTVNFYYATSVAWLCRRLGIKYITILHGGNLEHRLQNNPKRSKRLFSNAFRMISPSPFLKEAFERYGYSDITIIPNAIDLTQYTFQKRQKVGCKLLWVRAFAHIYNPAMAVKLTKRLVDLGYDASLCMVGPEKEDTSLAECQKLANQLDVAVTFTGKLSKVEWISLAEDYDIFINTTNFDNMPVSIIEAMALGLPIVSTNVGGIPFLLTDGENALLSTPDAVEDMAQHIVKLVQNPDLVNTLTTNARATAETFDWEAIRHQWKTILNLC